MSGDVHVRFREGGGVRLPSATRLVMLFAREDDARRVQEVLPRRLGKYGLRLHAEKTRLVPFGRPRSGAVEPQTFTFLGFTLYWGKSRKGAWVVKRKTSRKACDEDCAASPTGSAPTVTGRSPYSISGS